jgi:hypothetical protein
MSANRPNLKLVSVRSQSTDHLQELRRHVGVASLLIEVLTQEIVKAKAALAALDA